MFFTAIPSFYRTHKIGESQINRNNKQTKMLRMKKNGNIDSCQVPKTLENP